MKEYWKMLRRGLAMMLAVVMLLTSSNIGVVLRASATGADDSLKKELNDIVVELYADALSENLIEIIESGELAVEKTYTYDKPTDSELITIDEEERTITAKSYKDESGNVWTPVRYRLIAEGVTEAKGAISADEAVSYYYTGNAFSVEVDYEATLSLDEEQQNALLNSGALLAEDIAKLMLTGENIIPNLKPEGWENWSEQRQKAYKDYELIVKYDELQAYIDEMLVKMNMSDVVLTPQMVAMFMTMPVLAYDGQSDLSAIDLLSLLGTGIEQKVQIPEELADALADADLNNDIKDGELYVKIKFNNKSNSVVKDLLAQQEAGGLDLQKFLEANAGNSYLEWLMVPTIYEALVSAVTGNYDDIYFLITEAKALPGIVGDLEDLLADVETIEGVALDMISELLPDLNTTLEDNGFTPFEKDVVESKEDVDALVEHIEKVKTSAQGKLESALTLLNTELKTYGYTEEVKDSAGLEKALTWLDEETAKAEKAKSDALASANAIMAAFGYTGTITGVDDFAAAVDYLTAEAGDDLKEAQANVQAKVDAANALAKGYGYTGTISTAADVDKVAEWLQTQIDNDKTTLEGYVKTANDSLAQANAELPADQQYTGTVTGSADIADVMEWMKSLVSDAQSILDEKLAELNAELTANGYTGDPVETADDIDGVIAWVDKKVTDAEAQLDEELEKLNAELAEAGYTGTVNNSKDIDAVITWVNEQVADAEAQLKAELKNLNTELNNYGYEGTVETAADIDNVIAWVEGKITEAETKLAAELEKLNAELKNAGYTGTVKTSADMDAVITWAHGEAATKIAEAEQTIADARAEIASKLAELNTELADAGYTGTVKTSADMDAAIAYVENNAEDYIWGIANDVLAELPLPTPVSITSVDDVPVAKQALAAAQAYGLINATQYADAVAALDEAVAAVEDIPTIAAEMKSAKTTLADAEAKIADAEEQLADAEASVADKVAELKDAKADLAAVEKQLADAKVEVANKVADLKEGQKTLAEAEQKLADAKVEVANKVAELKEGQKTLADIEAQMAEGKKTAEETKADLREGQAQLAEAEKMIADADAMVAEYTATLESAEKAMKNLEDKIADKTAALAGQKAALTSAKNAIIAAEKALANLDTDEATAINDLSPLKAEVSAADVRVAEIAEQKEALNDWLKTITTVEGAMATLEDGLAQMRDVQAALGDVEENKATLVETIDMLDILITMLELFCQKIEPIYTACGDDSWNVRSVLKDYNASANYDNLTDWATGEVAPEVKIETSYKLPEATVSNNLAMWNVNVVVKGYYIGENNERVDLDDFVAGTVALIDGATQEQIVAAVEELNAEEAAEAFWGDLIEGKHFTIWPDMTLPETLTEDIVYEIEYIPEIWNMTYGEGFEGDHGLNNYYLDGWNLLLPVHENTDLEWEYTVNGEKFRQGTVVKITKNTTITREEGAASEKVALTTLAIETTAGMSQTAKNILNSEALKLNGVVYIRVPGDDQVSVSRENGETIVKAPNYDSNVAGDWVASTGVKDGVDVSFTDGVYTTNDVFTEIVVKYVLGVSAEDLGVSSAELNDYVNAGYELASDYNFQKSTLDNLIWALSTNDRDSGEVANLEGLSMLDRSYKIEMGGMSLTLGAALGAPESNAAMVGGMFGLSETAIAALADVLKQLNAILPSPEGAHPLYNTLKAYAESSNGMLHYYQNEQTYIDQLNQLNNIMAILPMDEMTALPATFYDLFNTIKVALGDAAALGEAENRIRTDMIDVESPYLGALLKDLAAYDLSEQYSVSGDLNWVKEISKEGPNSVKYSVTVTVEGAGSVTQSYTKNMDEVFNADAEAAAILEAKGWDVNDDYYSLSYTVSGTTYTYNYGYKTYSVAIPGGETAQLNLGNQKITLPGHANPAYAYDYTVAGEVIRVYNENYVLNLTPAQFEKLTIGGGVVTVEEINIAESSLTSLIEGMGGALYKNEAGEYTVVLGIDPNNTDSLMGLVMGLYMSGYESVSMGDAVLVSNGQFHLQTLVDVLLNSGISTNELNKNIASNGTITNTLDLPKGLTVVGTNTANGNHLTLVESSLTFGDLAPMNLYMTLTGDGSAFKSILSTVAGYGVDVVLENGSANLSVTIPEAFYTAYLAALSMVGEVDVDNVNDVNAEIALGYITSMITDIMNEEGVSIETFGNTIGKDLSAYGSYYDMAKSLMNLIVYNDDCTITLDLPVLPINGIIDSLAGSIQLPIEGISLGDMIAEYDTGLKVGVGAKFNNFANEYDVLFVDVKADGLTNKFGMKTLDEVGKLDFATTSVVVLLDNIENLYIHDTLTLVDLNGFNVTGKITGGANADVIVIDSNYEADRGVVGGVEGNVTVLAGKYLSDVSAFVNDGYKQDDNGVVCNKLFTVSETNDVITVTLNTTVADAKTLLTEEGVFGLAAEILFDQFINHYNVAAVSMDDNTIYNINFEDVLAIVSGGAGAIVDTALDFVYEDQLSAVFNTLVADLTDFAAIGAALSDNGTGVIASHKFATTTWGLELAHDSDDDTVSVNFGGSYGKTETKTLQLEIEGEARGAMAVLSTALGKVLDVDFTVDLDDIYRNDAGLLNIKGDVTGTVVFDFTENPAYAIMMSVILAENADEALRADLIEAIEVFYETGSLNLMRQVYNEMTIEDICNSWDEHIGVDSFVEIVDSLNLSCAEKIKSQIGDDEMGFDLLIDGIAAALRLLNEYGVGESVTDSGRTMGSLELEDENGYYYGRVGSFNVAGTNSLMDYELNATSVGAKIYLFTDDELPIADPSIEIDVEKITVDGKLYGVKYDEEKGYLILDTVAEGMTEAEVLAILTQGSVVENDINDMAEKIASNVVGSNGLVGTGSTFTLQAKNSVGETADVTVTIIILGDVSCDGVLNSGDSVLMHNYVLNRNNVVLTEIQKIAGNTNGLASSFSRDGIDSGDAVIVMNKWLNRYVESKLGEYESPLKN